MIRDFTCPLAHLVHLAAGSHLSLSLPFFLSAFSVWLSHRALFSLAIDQIDFIINEEE